MRESNFFMKLPAIKLLYVHNVVLIVGIFLFGSVAAGDPPVKLERECNSMTKPGPNCIPRSAPPTSANRPALPTKQLTYEQLEQLEHEKQWLKKQKEKAAAIPKITYSPEEIAEEVQWAKEHSGITLKNNGQTKTATADGSTGTIFLDDEKYPVSTLTITCQPKSAAGIGEPIYGSRGPDLYPVAITGYQSGNCVLRNRDFSVNIVVKDPPE
jgi:hypothetical protein